MKASRAFGISIKHPRGLCLCLMALVLVALPWSPRYAATHQQSGAGFATAQQASVDHGTVRRHCPRSSVTHVSGTCLVAGVSWLASSSNGEIAPAQRRSVLLKVAGADIYAQRYGPRLERPPRG